jgi:hypothetical protein
MSLWFERAGLAKSRDERKNVTASEKHKSDNLYSLKVAGRRTDNSLAGQRCNHD